MMELEKYNITVVGDNSIVSDQRVQTLINQFCYRKPTSSVEWAVKILDTEGNPRCRINLWNITRRYDRATQLLYYAKSDGIIVAFSVASDTEFQQIPNLIDEIDEVDLDKELTLVGYIHDSGDRVVSEERARILADYYGMRYFEVYGNTGKGMETALRHFIHDYRSRPDFLVGL